MNFWDKVIEFVIRRSKMFGDIQKWFIGNASKKRYLAALYVAIRAAAEALGHPFPPLADNLAIAFGIWAASDAIKKLEPK